MEYITTGNRIAVENFSRGLFYKITFLDESEIYFICCGIGNDFVMFMGEDPSLFTLTLTSAAAISAIDEYTPSTPITQNILQYQTGDPPFTFNTIDSKLFSWYIVGPAGDKTANLCNGVLEQGTLSESSDTGSTYEQTKSSSTQSNRVRTAQIVTCGGEVTISCDFTKYQLYLLYYDANGLYTGQHSSNWNSSAVTTNQQYIGIAIRRLNNADLSPNETDIKLMVNTGSTALPYEPFGYKIPILSNSILSNIYIDDPLEENEILYSTNTKYDINTDIGENNLSVQGDIQPTSMQIVYKFDVFGG